MIRRLWWKEARQFWPIAAMLIAVAVVMQGALILYMGKDARGGSLAVLAVGLTCLYGFAVAAASLAGEREAGTLLLLDALPAERWRVWLAKSSFALASTLSLVLLLLGIASISTESWPEDTARGVGMVATVLLQALGWGLFWSAITSNALMAAVLAVCTTGLVMPVLDVMGNLDLAFARGMGVGLTVAWQLGVAVASITASALIFVRSGPPRRPLPSWLGRSIPFATRGVRPVGRDRARVYGPAWPRTVFSLTWQTLREIWPIWWKLAAFGLLVILPWGIAMSLPGEAGNPLAWMIFGVGVGIVGGVSAFGGEYSHRTRRFLAHHAVRPGVIWLTKAILWMVVLAMIFLPLAALLSVPVTNRLGRNDLAYLPRFLETLWLFTAVMFGSTAVAMLCGMVMRRGITAAMVALLAILVIIIPVGFLFTMAMASNWLAPAVPIGVLAVGLAWSGDWLYNRPGVAKWIRLTALLVGASVLVSGWHVYDRAMNVPTLDPATEARYFRFTTDVGAPAQGANAADLYREAAARLREIPFVVRLESDSLALPVAGNTNSIGSGTIEQNREALRLVRRAAEMPSCQFMSLEGLTNFTSTNLTFDARVGLLIPLVASSVRERESRGDLAGAWEDILILFRFARHCSGAVPLSVANWGTHAEQSALGLAMNWAVDPRQTAESLQKAREAYENLPPMPPPADTVRAEALIVKNTGLLPPSKLADELLAMRTAGKKTVEFSDKLWVDAVTTSWELNRARKVSRYLMASMIGEAGWEPWQKLADPTRAGTNWFSSLALSPDGHPHLSGSDLQNLFMTTPLVQQLFGGIHWWIGETDHLEVARRALAQILAIRSWQVKHGGNLPRSLSELVPSELAELPSDPYLPNKPFGYVRSSGQSLLPLGLLELRQYDAKQLRPTGDSWLLYSVGQNRQDDRAAVSFPGRNSDSDIIFPLPDPNPNPARLVKPK